MRTKFGGSGRSEAEEIVAAEQPGQVLDEDSDGPTPSGAGQVLRWKGRRRWC